MLCATDNLLKEAEEKVVYRRFEQEHLGKLQTPADITQRLTDSGVGVALQGICVILLNYCLPPSPPTGVTITRVERAWTQDEQKVATPSGGVAVNGRSGVGGAAWGVRASHVC